MHLATAPALQDPTTRPTPASPIIAFVEATGDITDANEDFIFGDIELGQEKLSGHDFVDLELVEEVVGEIGSIRGNSGVGSPEVAKYVDAWQQPFQSDKAAILRSLAEHLYQRRPVLYLQGHPDPLPASVLLRTVQKPSISAITTGGAAAAAGLFKFPSNSFVVIKFDPKFGYADIIVDPFFTDAFAQQPATATYNELLASLPRAFVGTAAELKKVVALLTQQSMTTYAAKGATCPPWRRFDAMLARWLPKRFIDEPITYGPGAAAAAAPAAAATVGSPVNFQMAPLRTDSTASSNLSFSLSSGSTSSSSSSVPRTVVHGFDIPSRPSPAAAADATVPGSAAAAATETAAQQQMPPADSKDGARDGSGLLLLPSFVPVGATSPSSWQLAAVLAEPAAAAAAPAAAAAQVENDDSDDVEATPAASMPDAASPVKVHQAVLPVVAGTAAAAAAPAAAKPDEQPTLLPNHTPAVRGTSAADMSAQLLAANGYSSIRVVKMMGPSAAAAAATGTAAAAAGIGSDRGWCKDRGIAAMIPGKVRAVSFSGSNAPSFKLKQQGSGTDENNLSNNVTMKCPAAGLSKQGAERLPGHALADPLVAESTMERSPLQHTKSASLGNVSSLKFADQQELGLTAMVAKIRQAARQAAVAAAVAAAPAAGAGKVVCGRRVVRLDCNGTVVHSARAA